MSSAVKMAESRFRLAKTSENSLLEASRDLIFGPQKCDVQH